MVEDIMNLLRRIIKAIDDWLYLPRDLTAGQAQPKNVVPRPKTSTSLPSNDPPVDVRGQVTAKNAHLELPRDFMPPPPPPYDYCNEIDCKHTEWSDVKGNREKGIR